MSNIQLEEAIKFIGLLRQGINQLESGDFEAAIADFTTLQQLDVNLAEAYYYRGVAYRSRSSQRAGTGDSQGATEDLRRAIADFTQVVQINPQFFEAYYYRGATQAQLGNNQEALNDLLQLDASFERASLRYALQNYSEALADYTAILQTQIDNPSIYINRSLVYNQLGRFQEAASDCTFAIRLNPQTSSAYLNRGLARFNYGDLEGAIEDWEVALLFDSKNTQAYVNLAFACANLGQYNEALSYCDQALNIEPDFDHAYTNRCFIKNQLGSYQEALTDCDRSLNINPQLAETYYHRATTWYYLGNHQRAIEDYQQAATLYEQQELTTDRFYQSALNNILQIQQGNGVSTPSFPFAAEPIDTQLSAAQQQTDEEWRKGHAQWRKADQLWQEGNNLWRENEAAAEQLWEQAKQLWEEAKQSLKNSFTDYKSIQDKWGEAIAQTRLDTLAESYFNESSNQFSFGKYGTSRELATQALTIYEFLEQKRGQMEVFQLLGIFYGVVGNPAEAKQFFQRSLEIAKDLGDVRAQGTYLGDLADPNLHEGTDNSKAEIVRNNAQMSLDIAERYQDSRMKWLALDKLGLASYLLEDYPGAIDYQLQGLNTAIQSVDLEGISQACQNLGGYYNQIQNFPDAIFYRGQSVAIARTIGEKQTLALALFGLGLDLFTASQFMRDNSGLAEAESVLFEAIIIFEEQRQSLGNNDAYKISIFETQQETYEILQQVLVTQNKTDAALEVAERGRSQAFIELLKQRLSNTPNQLPQINRITIQQIHQIAQEQQATLVEYSVIADKYLYIWVIPPQHSENNHTHLPFWSIAITDFLEPSQGQTLEALIQEAINKINDRLLTLGDSGVLLYNLLLKRIIDSLPRDRESRIIFIPHKHLFRLPFALLHLEEMQNYLIDQHTILYAPAIHVLQLTHRRRQEVPGTAQNYLLVGNPAPMPPPKNNPAGPPLEPLKFAKEEAENIAARLNAVLGTSITPLIEGAAQKDVIKQRLSNSRFVSLATHAYTEEKNPLECAIALAHTQLEDGWLTANEIVKLEPKLQAELFILSACSTGGGAIKGDGVIGLSRSLFIAGTPSIVVSLWAVDDESTSFLMQKFIEYLYPLAGEEKKDKAQALRYAILETKKKYQTPFNWAPFILLGEAE